MTDDKLMRALICASIVDELGGSTATENFETQMFAVLLKMLRDVGGIEGLERRVDESEAIAKKLMGEKKGRRSNRLICLMNELRALECK